MPENPAQPLPRWGILNRTSGVLEDNFLAASVEHVQTVQSLGTGAQSLSYSVLLALPQDAKRVLLTCTVEHTYTSSSAIHTSDGAVYQVDENAASPASVNDLAFVSAAANTTFTQTYSVEWTRGGAQTDWLGSREAFEASPPTADTLYCRWEITVAAQAPSGRTATSTLTHTAQVVEIELENGTIYTPGANLDASLTTWLRVQAAKQDSFGTAVAPVFALPVVFDYRQGDIEQIAQWDAGRWTGTEIVELVAEYATFSLRGALFFELLPVLLSAGFGAMTPSGLGPYTYSGSAGQSAVGAPAPYTFRFGGNQGSGGSMVQVQDAYLHSLALSFNLNDKVVTFDSQWFGRRIDDNAGAGFAPAPVALPPGLAMVNGLLSTIGIQDAGVSGGAFDALDLFECSMIEWTLEVDTGLRPMWAADGNGLTYCGVRHEEPRATWSPHIRTTADNYAVTLTKAQLRQFQEVQLLLGGINREFVLRMTGRWQGKLNAHDRSSSEVIMQPKFQVATPHSQTTTAHWLSWTVEAGWEH